MAAFSSLPTFASRAPQRLPTVAVSSAPPAPPPTLATAADLLVSTPANFLLVPPTDPLLAAAVATVRQSGIPPPLASWPARADDRRRGRRRRRGAHVAVPPALFRVAPLLHSILPPLEVITSGDAAGTAALADAFAATGASAEAVAAVAAAATAAAAAHAAAVGVTPRDVRLRLAVEREVPCPRWHEDRVLLRGLATLSGGGTMWVDETAVTRGGLAGGGCSAPPGGCGCDSAEAATTAAAASAAEWGLSPGVRSSVLRRGVTSGARATRDEATERAAMEATGGVVRQAPVGALLFLKGGDWGDGSRGGAIHRSPTLDEGAGGTGRLILQTDDGV
ncbi:hypothetical protein MMPV_007445 [Pyropia vietnamensis]